MKKITKSIVLILCLISISLIKAMHSQAHVQDSHENLPRAQASYSRSSNISNHPPVEAMAEPVQQATWVSSFFDLFQNKNQPNKNQPIEAEVVGVTQQPSHQSLYPEKAPQSSAQVSRGRSTVFGSPFSPLNRPMTAEQQQNLWKFKQQNLGLTVPVAKVKAPKAVLATPVSDRVEIGEEPIIAYNAQGQKASEHFVNHDGSQQNSFYNADGKTTTLILDSNKVKQQEITTMPDKTQIIKYYNTAGKLESIEKIKADGSRVHNFNNLDGYIVRTEIYNPNNLLDAIEVADDFGQRTRTNYNLDGWSVANSRLIDMPMLSHGTRQIIPITTLDGRRKPTILNPDGSQSYTEYRVDGKTIEQTGTLNPDGSHSYALYQADGRTIKRTGTVNPEGSESYALYQADGRTVKKTGIFNLDGSKSYIEYQADGKTVKRVGNINPDDSETYIKYQADGISKKETGIIDKDGNGTYTRYSLLDDKIVTKKGIIKNNRLLV